MDRSILSAMLLLCSPLLMGGTVARADFNARLLKAQNAQRAALHVPPLKWDDSLARDARVWARELAVTGRFEHSPDSPDQEPQGEESVGRSPRAFSPEAMVALWSAERRDYRPGVFPDNSRSGDVENVGHYTQMIWRSTRQVGCATAVGRHEEFLVCRYSDAGNVYGERPA